MKSVVLTRYGDPVTGLEYREVPEPEEPGIGQVLVGIEFSPINFKILGLVRRAEVLDEVRAAGCDLALLDNDDAPAKTAEALGDLRPRLALDAISGEASGRLAKLLGPGGTFVSYAAPSFAPLAISPLDVIFNDLTVRGFSLYNPAFAEQIPQAIREAARMIAIKEVTVPITAIYPLDEIEAAVAHAPRGGKVLLEAEGAGG